jgi:hypothetical protein
MGPENTDRAGFSLPAEIVSKRRNGSYFVFKTLWSEAGQGKEIRS